MNFVNFLHISVYTNVSNVLFDKKPLGKTSPFTKFLTKFLFNKIIHISFYEINLINSNFIRIFSYFSLL